MGRISPPICRFTVSPAGKLLAVGKTAGPLSSDGTSLVFVLADGSMAGWEVMAGQLLAAYKPSAWIGALLYMAHKLLQDTRETVVCGVAAHAGPDAGNDHCDNGPSRLENEATMERKHKTS